MTNRSVKTDITGAASRLGRVPAPFLLSLWLLLSPLTILAASGTARAAIATIITAAKTDSFTEAGGDGKADPGQTIT